MDCPACHQSNVEGARFCAKCGALLPAPSSAQDSLIGQIVGGRYRVTQLLGEGGMGRVYLAEQQMGTNVRKVAVKTLQAQYAKDQQVLARFHRECGTVSELEHPNTIHFFDFGQTPDGQLYIAMEYVQGQSLSDALQQGGPMRPDRVLRILAQVCGSLEEAHRRGVVHRDLKPDNVILSNRAGQTDFVKVLDFGIAKRSEAKDQAQEQKLTQQGMVLGTPPYMSPEQFTGKELDARSDIYSLAVMAYEMLTGRLPFDAETPWQWATQHMTAQPFPFESVPAASGVPPSMKQAILRALSKDPAQRQREVRQFYEEIASGGTGAGASPVLAVAQPGTQGHGYGPAPTPQAAPAYGHAPTPQGAPAYGPPVGSAPGYTPPPAHVAHATPVGQTFPTTPQPQTHGGPPAKSGKGLIIALVAVLGVLGIAAVVVVVGQMGFKEAGPTPTATTVVAVPTTPPAPPPTATETAEAPKPTATNVAPAVKKTIAATPPSASVAPPPAPPPAPTLTGDAACAEAKRLGENGDSAGAARMFAGCSGPGAVAARAAIVRGAPEAVRRKVFNGDCAGARAIVTALGAIGAAAGAAAVVDAAPQCKK
jgi:tRNA A-37 threonylcarbamoyl transferase component Bud32